MLYLTLSRYIPITTKVVSLNPSDGKVSSIQLYVIKFVSYLRQVGGFLWVLQFPPPIKLTTTIAEILLNVTLNTLTLSTFQISALSFQTDLNVT